MNIQIGSNTDYLILKDIKLERALEKGSKSGLDFYKVTLALYIKGITTDIEASMIYDELSGLLSNLQKIYGTLQYTFVFKNIEDNINLKFTPDASGHINMEGYIRNSNYSARIEFKITTDQTYIPGTIKQLQQTLTEINT